MMNKIGDMQKGRAGYFKLRVSVTEICNLNCAHCFAKNNAKHLELPLFKKIVDDLYDMYQDNGIICYMGGEPLLYRYLIESLDYVASKNMKISLTTNGYHVDFEKLKKIMRTGDVILSISLDGPEEFHNKNRGKPDSYHEVMKTIEFVSGVQKRIIISVPYFKHTKKYFGFFDTLLENYNATLRFSRFVPVGRGVGILDNMASREDFGELFAFARDKNKGRARMVVEVMDPFFDRPGMGMRSCQCGKKLAFVNSDGSVWPCWRMQLPIGNIKYAHLRDILKNPLIDDYLDVTKKKGTCAVCVHKPVCKGGCHAVPYALDGDYHGEDPQCPFFSDETASSREKVLYQS
jgi:radical SAM protein with 4Fe4S-binding SPASM domain